MQTSIRRIGNRPENLSAQAEAVRARSAALLAASETIRYEVAQTRRESADLIDASRQVRLQCRVTAERSAARRRPSLGRADRLQIADCIARTLCELGRPAFIFEPSQDTAIPL